jgi:SpoVK/Ycf46/Vps4 family AAA+-type ATPase
MTDQQTVLAAITRDARAGPASTTVLAGGAGAAAMRTAETLAAALGKTVYRIDLAAVISKYAGDAEKHLELLLGEAARVDAVLLLDEADALFGQRSGVKDSHDRYANIETRHLFARIEAYAGVVLLATNRRTNVTATTTRQLRVVD